MREKATPKPVATFVTANDTLYREGDLLTISGLVDAKLIGKHFVGPNNTLIRCPWWRSALYDLVWAARKKFRKVECGLDDCRDFIAHRCPIPW